MQLAIIVAAHRDPQQLGRLLSALQHRRVRIYLHVDRQARLAPFERAITDAGVTNVSLLPRFASRWGTDGVVKAAMAGLAEGISDGCGYFMLISGQDFPLQPVADILAFAEETGARSHIEHWPTSQSRHRFHGRDRTDFYAFNVLGRRELCIPRGEETSFLGWKGRVLNNLLRVRAAFLPPRRFPPYARPFAGATWWNLSRVAAEYVLEFVNEHPDYRAYHTHTMVPEELFFQSLLAGTDFATEHEVLNESLRFYEWDGMHARILTLDDLPALLESEKLFARKLDATVDGAVLDRLSNRVMA